ncbi:hypothetical protein KY327_00285 [Candidatus Woesearchaeota archaeon]|nr:hypothetical protein [Candidatus Woesearchaeota archaeon]
MVLEHLFPENWLENKIGYAFLLGAVYSVVGIVAARLLFGANSGLASVMFVSILLLPSLKKLFEHEEKLEERERKFTLKHLYRDNKHLVHAYGGMFLGVFIAYFTLAFLGLKFGWDVTALFREQVFLDPAISGRAAYSLSTFIGILMNNWWVLLACFLLSLISGNGATFFIVWNASAWGVIFGLRSVAAGATLGEPAIGVALLMLAITLPHIILEGGAYILAGIAGALISDDVVSDVKDLSKFVAALAVSVGVFWLLHKAFSMVLDGGTLLIANVLLALGLLYLLKHVFPDKRHKEVFTYNYWLFVIALAVFAVGALVETGVLTWSGLLNEYYFAAAQFFA